MSWYTLTRKRRAEQRRLSLTRVVKRDVMERRPVSLCRSPAERGPETTPVTGERIYPDTHRQIVRS